MKKSMKAALWLSVLSVMILLGGCGQKDTKEANKLGEQFLKEIFTSNAGGRYDTFAAADITDDEKLNTASAQYYKEMAALVTENLLEELKSNRIPLTYDKNAAEQSVQVTVSNVVLTEKETEGDFHFTVSLKMVRDGKEDTAECTGTVRTDQTDGEEKVSRFFCDETSEYFQKMEEMK